MGFSVIRAGDRSRTTTAWLTAYHCFSFGDHYDPDNTHHGVLIAENEDFLAAGTGFESHHHQDSEIVTWVSAGSLVHHDSAGHSGVVYPGLAQRMSAGRGIDHSERNDPWPNLAGSGVTPTHYVQMWVFPDRHGIDPSYAQHDVSDALADGGLVAVASGDPARGAAIDIANSAATLFAARPPAGHTLIMPTARFVHLFVVHGAVSVDAARHDRVELSAGDAARGFDTGGEVLTATESSEVLIWAMDKTLGEV